MTAKIPDGVVEGAWEKLMTLGMSNDDALRAAGRVFMAWEREQCAKIAEGEKFGWSNFYQRFLYCRWSWRKEGSSTTHSNESVLAYEIAAAIRARSAPEKE